jgi:hypothetical protein
MLGVVAQPDLRKYRDTGRAEVRQLESALSQCLKHLKADYHCHAMMRLHRRAAAPPPTCGRQHVLKLQGRHSTGLLLMLLLLIGVHLLLQHVSRLWRGQLFWQPRHLLLRLRHQQLSTS